MAVAVLVPYRGTDEHRRRALRFVLDRLRGDHPDWTVSVGGAGDGRWCKGAAVAALRRATDADVLVVLDADVVADPGQLRTAVDIVDAEPRCWAVPHEWVCRLDEASTGRAYEDPSVFPPTRRRLDRGEYRGVVGGGCVVLAADLYDEAPIDPRFHTWGSEDDAWGCALTTIAGPPWQPAGAGLWHLWHPHAVGRPSRHAADQPSAVLLEQYRRARGYPDRMAEVVLPARRLAGLSSDACPDSWSAAAE